jgi:hypothetical protein
VYLSPAPFLLQPPPPRHSRWFHDTDSVIYVANSSRRDRNAVNLGQVLRLASRLLHWHECTDVSGSKHLSVVGKLAPDYTVQRPRNPPSSERCWLSTRRFRPGRAELVACSSDSVCVCCTVLECRKIVDSTGWTTSVRFPAGALVLLFSRLSRPGMR